MLVTEHAGFELSKGTEPFVTWRNSLALLSEYPECVFASRKMTALLREERASQKPCDGVIDERLTAAVRQLLRELANDEHTLLHEIVDGTINVLLPKSIADQADAATQKEWVKVMGEGLRSSTDEELLRAMRKNPRDAVSRWLCSDSGLRYVYQGIRSSVDDDIIALNLAQFPSISAAFVSACGALCMYWLAFGGLESVAPDTIVNDWNDLEYAVIASISSGLLTKDKRLRNIYTAISDAMIYRRKWFAAQGLNGLLVVS